VSRKAGKKERKESEQELALILFLMGYLIRNKGKEDCSLF